MSILPIAIYGDKVLRQKTQEVKKITPELAKLADDMLETMYDAPGVGLAAPQVYKSIRLIVLDVSYAEDEDKREPFILFNPVITHSSGEVMDEEGCLSFPGINGQVIRPETITVSAINIKGEPFILKDADGLLARCIQHEMDHLNGVLFVDKFSDSDKWINQGKLKKLVKKSRGT